MYVFMYVRMYVWKMQVNKTRRVNTSIYRGSGWVSRETASVPLQLLLQDL